MREIKFRGQRADNKEWIYGFYQYTVYNKAYQKAYNLIQEDGHYIYPAHIDSNPKEILIETVGQFTGLKDKNGVEIYEGDILENINGEVRVNNEWGPNREISIVVWEDAAFALKSPGSDAVDWSHSSYYHECAVIGNIYSNPELLK